MMRAAGRNRAGEFMGIYDRPYYRDEQSGGWLGGRSMVINLIILNAAVYLIDLVAEGRVSNALSLKSDLLTHPWQAWQLITYGFVHDRQDPFHILLNMYGLWLFGRDVEEVYGRAEFVRIYLVTIILSGLVWVIATGADSPSLVGASGGVMGMMILFVLHFPKRMFALFGIVPVPAWALGAMYVAFDVMGVINRTGNIAHVAHLTGVAFGFAYYRLRWNLGKLVPARLSSSMFRLKPKLRIHDPQEEQRDLNQQVDQILEKISREGEASLTKKERRTLEEASRKYQRRRQ